MGLTYDVDGLWICYGLTYCRPLGLSMPSQLYARIMRFLARRIKNAG
jgi:hypothetical protein